MPLLNEPRPTGTEQKSTLSEQLINEYYDVSSRKKEVVHRASVYTTCFEWKQISGNIQKVIIRGNEHIINMTVLFDEEISNDFYTGFQRINCQQVPRYEIQLPHKDRITIVGIPLASTEYLNICDLLFPAWYSHIHNSPRQPKNGAFFLHEHQQTINRFHREHAPSNTMLISFRHFVERMKTLSGLKKRQLSESATSASTPGTPMASNTSSITIKFDLS